MMTLLVGNWFHPITKGKKKKKIQLTRSRWSLQVYDASPYVSVFEGIARRIKKRKTHACVENLHGHSFDGWTFFPGLAFFSMHNVRIDETQGLVCLCSSSGWITNNIRLD